MRTIFRLAALGGIVYAAKRVLGARAGARTPRPSRGEAADLGSGAGSVAHESPGAPDPVHRDDPLR